MAQQQNSMVEGAKAGAAFGPWGAAIGGAAGLAKDIALAPDTGISSSGGGQFDLRSSMDGSGWTVSTGSSKAAGGDRHQTAPQSLFNGGMGGMGGASMAGMDPMMLLLLLAFGYAIWKR